MLISAVATVVRLLLPLVSVDATLVVNGTAPLSLRTVILSLGRMTRQWMNGYVLVTPMVGLRLLVCRNGLNVTLVVCLSVRTRLLGT